MRAFVSAQMLPILCLTGMDLWMEMRRDLIYGQACRHLADFIALMSLRLAVCLSARGSGVEFDVLAILSISLAQSPPRE